MAAARSAARILVLGGWVAIAALLRSCRDLAAAAALALFLSGTLALSLAYAG